LLFVGFVLHYLNTKNKLINSTLEEVSTLSSKSLVFKNKFKQKHPKFSIIVPVYQEEKIIESHLKLFSEELRKKYNFELIVSDGGSTDNTAVIAQMYADVVVMHNSTERQTISQGRNRGADYADGEILCFLNVDSVPADLTSFLELNIEFAERKGDYSKYDAIACYVSGFPDEVLLKDKIFYTFHNNYVHLLNLIGFGMGRGECQIVRRETFNKVNGYNDNIVAGEDFDLYRRISKISKIKFDRKINIHESPRRFRKYGYIKTIFFWILNSLTVWWFGKSVSKEWEAVR
jgi:glycosyltransferase involved in cell wall biosynthesis